MALLHHAGVLAIRSSTQVLRHAGRQFYDVYPLLGSTDVITALAAPGQAMEILAADVDAKSAEFGWDHTPRPRGGYAASPVFDPAGPLREAAAASCGRALSLIWGERPDFDEVLTRIAELASLL